LREPREIENSIDLGQYVILSDQIPERAAHVQGMSAQACDGACNALLKRMIDIALKAWPKKR